ncbi:MmyB family transcriptional regulator [Paractinoplanes lichenicola]|uniref:MmyB-like transcription regulator ligand binding domain-containing protein n=1 Tax=Paractinoplanes lichenicola TaxID=2802976 RepID=A0ABS1VWD5_9ACTN|nr:hypothetical protein [Actinoplanes lichenicola]MBL7258801.1 hypothetical protein [Actinoplanes lichenicola]
MDRARLAAYLRTRREAVQPEDVGLPRGRRRRAPGHPVAGPYCGSLAFEHPVVGRLQLDCQRLLDPDQSQEFVVYTAALGTESAEKLHRLAADGALLR